MCGQNRGNIGKKMAVYFGKDPNIEFLRFHWYSTSTLYNILFYASVYFALQKSFVRQLIY